MTEVSLREPTFLILTALAVGPQHGYGIMTDVSQISGGRVDREEIVAARLRRYYRLTPRGAQRLEAEVDRMRSNTAVAARRLGLLGGTP